MGSNFSPFVLQDLWDNLCILTTLAHAISGIESQFPVSVCFLFVSFVSRKIASSLRQTIWMLIICYKIRTTTVSSLGAAIFSFYFSLAKHNIRASLTHLRLQQTNRINRCLSQKKLGTVLRVRVNLYRIGVCAPFCSKISPNGKHIKKGLTSIELFVCVLYGFSSSYLSNYNTLRTGNTFN